MAATQNQRVFDATALTSSEIDAAGADATAIAALAARSRRASRRLSSCHFLWVVALAAACGKPAKATTPRDMPMPSVQVGACGQPGVDGVLGKAPKLERWDRDLDGDGVDELVVVDRAMCSDDNCYWNVFRPPPAGTTECSRYAGTFAAAALEPLAAKGEDNMRDIRGYWHLHGGRLLLQSYRYIRGGYQLVDALLCRRAADDKLECTDSDR